MFPVINSCDGRYSSSLDVRFTKVCDNACSFCIEAPGLPDLGTDVEAMIRSTLQSGKKNVLILGGEPLLMLEKVLVYVKAIREHVDEIYVTTSLPRVIGKKKDTFLELVALLDGLNISLQHYDWVRNNEILQARNRFNRIEMLKALLQEEEVAKKSRVSINLARGGVDSKEELWRFLEALKGIGCRHVKINELQDAPGSYVSFEELSATRLPSPYSNGCQTEIKLFEGMKVTLKRSCFLVEPSLAAAPKDLAKVLHRKLFKRPASDNGVLYENGRLEKGWVTQERRSS